MSPGRGGEGALGRRLVGLAMVLPPVALVFFLVGFPIVVAIGYSLGHVGGLNSAVSAIAQHQVAVGGGIGTLEAYREVLTSHQFLTDLVATLWVTALSTALVVLLAWGIGLYLRLSESRAAKALSALSVVPLFIPVVIASYALLAFWSGGGFVRSAAAHLGMARFPILGYTLPGVVIGQVWVNLPFGVLMISSGLQRVPTALIDAARDVGASLARTTLSVLVPMNLVPTVIVVTFTAIAVLGSFTVPYLIGPTAPTLLGPQATVTFQSFNEPQQAEVVAMVLFLLAVGVGSAYVRATMRGERVPELAS
ncbi:MAG TPA: ABC transporter permease subunit [Candidatus Dormibacteraeota bacterium]|jgi:ABC-type spermidine/putrescine transport system permease subunit I|nr:ABC transporter permease subunit [Candidatus Dormibacteraeota bacterium]